MRIMTARKSLEQIDRLVRILNPEAGQRWNDKIMDMVREILRLAFAEHKQNHERFRSLPDAINAWRKVPPDVSGSFDEWLFDTVKEKWEKEQ